MSRSVLHGALLRMITCCGLLFLLTGITYAQEDTTKTIIEQSPVIDTASPAGIDQIEDQTAREKYFTAVEEQDRSADSLQLRHFPDSLTRKMKQEDDFWYADKDFRKKKEAPKEDKEAYVPLGQRVWFRTLLWLIVIGGFLAFIIWYLAGTEFGLFRKRPQQIGEDPSAELEMPENIFEINYQRELDKAIARGDYRLGVRLLYLQLLKKMAEKNVISYKQDKTNSDYLFTLLSSRYYDGFFRLTRHYEYTWYGHFEVPEPAFGVIRSEFEQYQKQHL